MSSGAARSLQRAWPAGLLVLAAALLYAFTLDYPFIFDDYTSVLQNPRVQTLWPPTEPLTVDPDTTVSSRPLIQLSLALNYAISRLEPWSYRLTNIALHALCATLAWRLLIRLLREAVPLAVARRLAITTALIWVIHPLHTETVVYVTQRTELLVSLFLLATMTAALRGFDLEAAGFAWGARRWWALAVACCWLGMASKEVMAGAPLLVLLVDRAVVSGTWAAAIRRHWALYVALAGSWLLLAALVVLSPRTESAGFDVGIRPLHYLYTQAHVLVVYLKLAFWPHPLSIVYHVDLVKSLAGALPQGLLIAAMLLATGVAVWRNRLLGVAGAWFFVILAPSSSFVPIAIEVAAERRMYLPLLAVLAVTLVVIDRVLRAASPRLGQGLAMVTVLFVLVVGTLVSIHRLQQYSSEIGIWEDAIRKHPDSYLAHQGYGTLLMRMGEKELGFQHRLRAVEINPFIPERTLEVTSMLVERGRFEEALHWLTHLKDYAEPHAVVLVNRGGILAHLGREAEAEADLQEAAAVDPTLPEPWLNLGVMRARHGRLEEARALVLEALRRAPDSVQARAVLQQIERDLAAGRAGVPGGT